MTTYAINKETKEHRLVPYAMDGDATWSYVDTDENGFISWHWKGKECPVDDACIVDVKFRNGTVMRRRKASEFAWCRAPVNKDDITGYRPISAICIPYVAPNTKYTWGGQECTLLGKSQQHGQAAIQIDDTNELCVVDLDALEPSISTLVDEAVRDIQMEPDVHEGTIYDIVGRMIKKGYRKP